MGFVTQHAYSLNNVADVVSSYGQQTTIVQIRNPWGSFEWNGAWSDNSEYWTPESRAQCSHEESANDGTFWISL
jgi:hypothetical protein